MEDHVEQRRAEESLPTRISGSRSSGSFRQPHLVCSSADRGHEESAAASASPGWRARQSRRGPDLVFLLYSFAYLNLYAHISYMGGLFLFVIAVPLLGA